VNQIGKELKMKFRKMSLITTFTLVIVTMLMAGCNTIEGMGKDIEAGGEKIQDTAD
jgi:predicted small secreted protein